MRRTPFVLSLLASASALAAVPEQPMVLVHSGYLLDGNDHPVSEPEETMTFRIFDRSAPVAGETKIWEGSCAVPVQNGHYAVTLGQGCGTNLLPSMLPTSAARYLEVSVGTTALLPRMVVGAVPTAAVATNALALEGQPLAALDARYARFQADPAIPQAGSLALDGTLAAKTVKATGEVAGATVSASGALSANSAAVTNGLSAGALTTTGGATIGSGAEVGGDATIHGNGTIGGNATVTGALQAATFTGDGAHLTNLDAGALASGTIPDGRLAGTQSEKVSFPNVQNTFTGAFSGTFTGNLNGSVSGTISGNGAGITALNGANVATGTISDARLSSNVARLDGNNAFTGAQNTFGGKVGIGTNAPNAPLEVRFDNATSAHNSLSFQARGVVGQTGAQNVAITVPYAYPDGVNFNDTRGYLDLIKTVGTNTVLATRTDGAALGNVGIGTTNPQATLDVAGTVKAQSLTVNNTSMPVCGIFQPNHATSCTAECQNFSALAKAAGWNHCVPRPAVGNPGACGGRGWFLDHSCGQAVDQGYTYFETRFSTLSGTENTAGGGGALFLQWGCCNDITPSFWCCQ